MQVTVPDEITNRFSQVNLELTWPGQISLVSPYTGTSQILNRGYQIWTGSIAIPLVPAAEVELIQQIEAFLNSFAGQENFADLKIHRPVIPDNSRTVTSQDVDTSTGVITTRFSANLRGKVGDYLTIENRLFQIIALDENAARNAVLVPQRPINDAANVDQGLTIRARMVSSNAPTLSSSPDWSGPWTINFQEVG